MSETTSTSRKATRVGVVTSNAPEKSVVVTVQSFVIHPLYQRFVRRTTKFMAHDEENACNVGDRVLIEECRPLSKRKRWRVRRIVERAK
jgi:small subunit ribosomal protein S17